MRIPLILLLSLVACGGKILYTNADDGLAPAPPSDPPSFAPPPEPTTPAPDPAPVTVTVAEACSAFCERNAKCGKHTVTCVEDCFATAGDTCNGSAWITCAGGTPGDRCNLPPACEAAYCAWARCAGRYVPDYC